MALNFIIGESKCGKSEYAERVVSAYSGTTLYIGTLPTTHHYQETISLHKNRRPSEWGLLELKGNPYQDISSLIGAFKSYKNVLLDGLAFYILKLTNSNKENFRLLRQRIEWLVKWVARRECEVFIVDHVVPSSFPRLEQCIVRDLHRIIAWRSDDIILFSNDKPNQISKRYLLNLERIKSRSKVNG